MQNKPIGPTNELAKERNRAAAERTMTAWIQNCLVLVGFGFTVEQIFIALAKRLPEEDPTAVAQLAHQVGGGFIFLGVGLLILAIVQHRIELHAINRDDYLFLPSTLGNTLEIIAIVVFGILGIVILGLEI